MHFAPMPVKLTPTTGQLKAMGGLVDAMNLDAAKKELDALEHNDARGKQIESLDKWLTPSMRELPNPVLQRFYSAVQQRALDPVDEPPTRLPQGGYTNEAGHCEHLRHPTGLRCDDRRDAQAAYDELRGAFERRVNHDVSRKRRFATVDSGAEKGGGLSTFVDDTAAKKQRGADSQADGGAAGLMPTQRDTASGKIGMTNPLDDFAAMWNDHPEKAFKEMSAVIVQLVDQSVRGHLHDKAVVCLRQLRKDCKQDDDWEPINDFLRELRGRHGTAGKPNHAFWEKVVEAGVTLIDTSECEDSDTTPDGARAFLSGGAAAPARRPAPVQQAPPQDMDDMLDELE